MDEDKEKGLSRIEKFVRKHFKDFEQHIVQEKDLSIILLKGHLLIEYYLEHLVLLFFDKSKKVSKMGFYGKVCALREKNVFNVGVEKHLLELNDVRNSLAHRLDFQISTYEIDKIGYNMGKDYILKKLDLEVGSSNSTKELLIWVISEIASDVYVPVISKVILLERESAKTGGK